MISFFSKSMVIFSSTIFAFMIYKLSIHQKELELLDLLICTAIIVLLIISILNLFLKKSFSVYIVVVIYGLISSLYLFEIYLIFTEYNGVKNFKTKKIELYLEESKKKYDSRNMFEIYTDLKKKDNTIVSKIPPYLFLEFYKDIFPVSGMANSKTIMCNENGYWNIYLSDRYGFNNPDYEWDKEKIEFLLVGDSFAHGACLNRPNDMASVLRNISKKSLINLGYSSNGPLIEYVGLREYLKKDTKNIIWLYFEGNDNVDLYNEIQNKILSKYLSDTNFSQDLINKQKLIDKRTKELLDEEINRYSSNLYKFDFINLIKLVRLRGSFSQINKKTSYSLLENILIKSVELAKINNSEFYFVYLPQFEKFTGEVNNNNYNKVKSIIKKLDINFIDVQEMIGKSNNPLNFFPFGMGGHYNNYGQRIIAEYIYQYINNEKSK